MGKRLGFQLIFMVVGLIWWMGCAAPQQSIPELTPEQIAARQDSIAKANEQELKKWRMFAYDKVKEKNWLEAREYFWKVVSLDVRHEYNDWARIYQTYTETGDIDSAQTVLRKGLEYFPNDPFLNATYGFYLKAQGQYESALGHYETAIQAEPDNLDYLKKKAELLETLGRGEEAIAVYEKILALDQKDQESKDRYTSLLKQYRDPEEYIRSLEQDVQTNPEDINKQLELVAAYSDQGLNEKVIQQAEKIITLDSTNLEAYHYKATAQENLNKLKDAIATYKALIAIALDNAEAMLRIADDSRLLGNFATARTWVLKARNAGGNSPAADFILAQVYESAGDKCSEGRGIEFDDKLVYVIAYGLYQKAAAGNDFTVKDNAARRVAYMEQFVPQYSDYFMNKSKKMPVTSCYSWIKASWPEVKYINVFLGNLARSKG